MDRPAHSVTGASRPGTDARPGRDAPVTSDFFNPYAEIQIHEGNLPHWEQGSVWAFITFRLADSIPREAAERIRAERECWLARHGKDALSPEEVVEYHTLFSERMEQLLDAGQGSCLLKDPENAQTVAKALRHFDGQRYALDEWVVKPNHVHVLMKPLAGHAVPEIVQAWKSFTSHAINKRLGRTGMLWMPEAYDHLVRSERALFAIRRYIRENPAKAGIVAGASRPGTDARPGRDAPVTLGGEP